jgi:hypothetical protein
MKYLNSFFLESSCSLKAPGIEISCPPFILVLFVLVLFGSLIWVARDALRRGKSGIVAVLFALVAGWPLSLAWWFWLRPSTGAGRESNA